MKDKGDPIGVGGAPLARLSCEAREHQGTPTNRFGGALSGSEPGGAMGSPSVGGGFQGAE